MAVAVVLAVLALLPAMFGTARAGQGVSGTGVDVAAVVRQHFGAALARSAARTAPSVRANRTGFAVSAVPAVSSGHGGDRRGAGGHPTDHALTASLVVVAAALMALAAVVRGSLVWRHRDHFLAPPGRAPPRLLAV